MSRTLTRIFTVALLAALAGGCMTPYQPNGYAGGYVDRKLADRVYAVTFAGNGNTPRDRVFRFWLYRCAELTLQEGYSTFSIAGRQRQADAGPTHDPTAGNSTQYELTRVAGYVPTYTFIPGGYRTITRYSARGVIRMYPGIVASGNEPFFRASEVIADLGPEVKGNATMTARGDKKYDPDEVLGTSSATPATASTTQPAAAQGEKATLEDLKDLLPDPATQTDTGNGEAP